MSARFMLREPNIDKNIQCEEISDNGNWITYGDIVNMLNKQEKENKKFQDETRNLLNDEFRGLFTNYLRSCRSISEEAIITLIRRDVKKIVEEVFEE